MRNMKPSFYLLACLSFTGCVFGSDPLKPRMMTAFDSRNYESVQGKDCVELMNAFEIDGPSSPNSIKVNLNPTASFVWHRDKRYSLSDFIQELVDDDILVERGQDFIAVKINSSDDLKWLKRWHKILMEKTFYIKKFQLSSENLERVKQQFDLAYITPSACFVKDANALMNWPCLMMNLWLNFRRPRGM